MTKLRWDRPTGSSPDPGRVIDVGAPLLTTPAGRKRLADERARHERIEARAKRKAAKLRERQREAAKRYWEKAAKKAAARRETIFKAFANYNEERLARKLKRLKAKDSKAGVEQHTRRASNDSGAKSTPAKGGPDPAKGRQLGIALLDALRKRN